MMAVRSRETQYYYEKPGPIEAQNEQFLQYQSDCEICELLLLTCKCNRIFDSIEELKTLQWERDSKP